jgi:hypothetical protein
MPGCARPLPIPPRGRDDGEVVCLLVRCVAKSDEWVMASLHLSAWPGFLGLAGPRSFGLLLADILWAAWPTD